MNLIGVYILGNVKFQIFTVFPIRIDYFEVDWDQHCIIITEKSMNNMKQAPKFLSGDRELYDKYTICRERVVGRGYSYVYEAIDEEGTQECVKEVRLEDNMSQFIFRKEVELLNKLKVNPHPNIVEFRGSYCLQERNHLKHRKGYIQMEKGISNLKEYLAHRKEKNTYLSEDDVLSFISSMLDAFTHLQKVELAHRDVKPSNILIFSEDPLFFKVCDVGAGTAVGICDMTENRTVIGTPYYLSPELFQAYRQKQHLTNYKVYKSDCYSLGLVFLEFCTLKRIQDRLNGEKERIESTIGEIKKIYPNIVGIGKVLRRMLDENVKTRMDFLELESYIYDNDLLRNKINSEIQLDPELISKLTTSQEILIETFEDLTLLSKIASSGNSAPLLRINLTTNNGSLKKIEMDLLEELVNLRHINTQDLELNIEMCGLTEKEAEMIGSAIAKNSNLSILKLKLWNNEMKSEGLALIMQGIQAVLHNLEELQISLPNNGIKMTANDFESLFSFESATKLTALELNLGFNEISPDAFQRIMKGLTGAAHLRSLDLHIEKIRINHISFSKGIRELQKLSQIQNLTINASDNSLRDEGMFGLSDLLASFPKLTQCCFLIRNVQFADKGFTEFMKGLSGCMHLEKLKINIIQNGMVDKNIRIAQNALEKLEKLSVLDFNVSNNKIGDSGIKALLGAFSSCKNISKLRLIADGCDLTEKGCLYYGRLISQLPFLTDLELSLRYNEIMLKGIQCICTGLLSTKKVKRLKLILEATKIGDYAANYLASCLLKIRGLSFVDLNMENCELGEVTMENITKLVKECSKKAEEITVNMRRNQEIKLELYTQIKKELNNSRIAIRVDNPSTHSQSLSYSQTSL